MKWIHVKAVFEADDVTLAEELVADMFLNLGLQGIVCQVPLDEPEEGFGSDAVLIPDETWVSGYIPDTDNSREILRRIKERAKAIINDTALGIEISIETETVDQMDWAEAWKSFFHVTRITDRVVVKPEWREFSPTPDEVVIEIDPGMAFGTGTHPTTFMCIEMIEKYLKVTDTFLDVGTGSGILMIAAAKLGAASLVGIDTDEVAVQVAGENLEKNGIDGSCWHVEQNTLDQYLQNIEKNVKPFYGEDANGERIGDEKFLNRDDRSRGEVAMDSGGKGPDGNGCCFGRFHVVAANIIAEVLVAIMPELKRSLLPGGVVILSGIIQEREVMVLQALEDQKMVVVEIKREGEWMAIVATR